MPGNSVVEGGNEEEEEERSSPVLAPTGHTLSGPYVLLYRQGALVIGRDDWFVSGVCAFRYRGLLFEQCAKLSCMTK